MLPKLFFCACPVFFIPKTFAEELRNCQRYLLDLTGSYRMGFTTADFLSFVVGEGYINKMRVSPTLVNLGVEGIDWNIFTTAGSTQTGFNLVFTAGATGEIAGTKVAHGVADAFLRISTTGKVFADAEL